MCAAFTACSAAFSSTSSRLVSWHWRNPMCVKDSIWEHLLCLFLTYNLDLTAAECHFCWPDWQETRVLSQTGKKLESFLTEVTRTRPVRPHQQPPPKALRSQPWAFLAIGYHNMLRAAIHCLQPGFQFQIETIGLLTLEESNVCVGLYMGTLAVPVPHLQSWLDSQWMSLLLARLARN